MVRSVSTSAAESPGPASSTGLTDRRVLNRLKASDMARLRADGAANAAPDADQGRYRFADNTMRRLVNPN
jgi:hypothetical protein